MALGFSLIGAVISSMEEVRSVVWLDRHSHVSDMHPVACAKTPEPGKFYASDVVVTDANDESEQ